MRSANRNPKVSPAKINQAAEKLGIPKECLSNKRKLLACLKAKIPKKSEESDIITLVVFYLSTKDFEVAALISVWLWQFNKLVKQDVSNQAWETACTPEELWTKLPTASNGQNNAHIKSMVRNVGHQFSRVGRHDLSLVISARLFEWSKSFAEKIFLGSVTEDELWESLRDIKPALERYLLDFARSWVESNSYELALVVFARLLGLTKDQAKKLYSSNLTPEHAWKILASINSDSLNWLGLARCWEMMKRHDLALVAYTRLLSLKKASTEHLWLANLTPERVWKFLVPIKLHSAGTISLLAVARCWEKMGRYELALVAFAKRFALTSVQAKLFCSADLKAEDGWELLASAQSDNVNDLALARCWEMMGRYDLALVAYSQLLRLQKESEKCLWSVDLKPEDAWKLLTSIKLDHVNSLGLARCWQAMGRTDLALLSFAKLLGLTRMQVKGLCFSGLTPENAWEILASINSDTLNWLGLARCWEEMDRYDLAVVIFSMLSGIKKTRIQDVCSSGLTPEDVWELLAPIQLDNVNTLSLGRCWEEVGSSSLAITVYARLLGLKKESAKCLWSVELKPEIAWELLSGAHPGSLGNPLDLARCWENMGRYDLALVAYAKLFDLAKQPTKNLWSTDLTPTEAWKLLSSVHPNCTSKLLDLARCWQAMGSYDLALLSFAKLLGLTKMQVEGLCSSDLTPENAWEILAAINSDKLNWLGLARCWEEMDDYNLTLVAYAKLFGLTGTQLKRLYSSHLTSAGAWEILESIRSDKMNWVSLARFWEEINRYDLALVAYAKLFKLTNYTGLQAKENWAQLINQLSLKPKSGLLSFAIFCSKRGRDKLSNRLFVYLISSQEQALDIETPEKIRDFLLHSIAVNPQYLLPWAHSYFYVNQHEFAFEVMKFYIRLSSPLKQSAIEEKISKVKLKDIIFLLKIISKMGFNDECAAIFAILAKRFPYHQEIHRDKWSFQLFNNRESLIIIKDEVEAFLEAYPYSFQTYLWWHRYLTNHDDEAAVELYIKLKTRFPTHKKFLAKLCAQAGYEPEPGTTEREPLETLSNQLAEEERNLTIANNYPLLHQCINKLNREFLGIPGIKWFLTGTGAFQVVAGDNESDICDYDIYIYCNENDLSKLNKILLEKFSAYAIPYVNGLFVFKIGGKKIDARIKLDEENTIQSDFQHSSLRLSFPPDSQLVQLQYPVCFPPNDERVLRTTKNAVESFREDPSRVLRAIHQKAAHGFKSSEELNSAIRACLLVVWGLDWGFLHAKLTSYSRKGGAIFWETLNDHGFIGFLLKGLTLKLSTLDFSACGRPDFDYHAWLLALTPQISGSKPPFFQTREDYVLPKRNIPQHLVFHFSMEVTSQGNKVISQKTEMEDLLADVSEKERQVNALITSANKQRALLCEEYNKYGSFTQENLNIYVHGLMMLRVNMQSLIELQRQAIKHVAEEDSTCSLFEREWSGFRRFVQASLDVYFTNTDFKNRVNGFFPSQLCETLNSIKTLHDYMRALDKINVAWVDVLKQYFATARAAPQCYEQPLQGIKILQAVISAQQDVIKLLALLKKNPDRVSLFADRRFLFRTSRGVIQAGLPETRNSLFLAHSM